MPLYGHLKVGQLWNKVLVKFLTQRGFTQSVQDKCFFFNLSVNVHFPCSVSWWFVGSCGSAWASSGIVAAALFILQDDDLEKPKLFLGMQVDNAQSTGITCPQQSDCIESLASKFHVWMDNPPTNDSTMALYWRVLAQVVWWRTLIVLGHPILSQDDQWGGGGDGIFFGNLVIYWSTNCKMQKGIIALSTTSTEAEFINCVNPSCPVCAANFQRDRNPWHKWAICDSIGDNKPAISCIWNDSIRLRTKHLDVRPKFCGEVVREGLLKIKCISTTNNILEIFTKPLPSPRFRMLWDALFTDIQL